MEQTRPRFSNLSKGQVRWVIRALALDAMESSNIEARHYGKAAFDRAVGDMLTADDVEYARDVFNAGEFVPPSLEED